MATNTRIYFVRDKNYCIFQLFRSGLCCVHIPHYSYHKIWHVFLNRSVASPLPPEEEKEETKSKLRIEGFDGFGHHPPS